MKKEKEVLDKEEKKAKKKESSKAEEIQEETADQESAEENDEPAEEPAEKSPEEEVAEYKDKYLRLYSEFENFRRRTAKEKIELIGTASREVIESLLPVMDDMERALKAGSKEDNEGAELIYNKFSNVLKGKGLKLMEVNPGDEFDDDFHDAITQIPAPEKKLAGKIVDVVEPGYFLGEKVIRFAKVVTGAKE